MNKEITTKFKVGDIVIGNDKASTYFFTDKGWKGKVIKTYKDYFVAVTLDSTNSAKYDLSYDKFDLLEDKKFTLDDLQFGDILTLRNGERYVFASGYMYGEYDNYGSDCDGVDAYYKEDLVYDEEDSKYRIYDIVKIEREGRVIFERENEVKEMTVEEISKALGYEVKVVK